MRRLEIQGAPQAQAARPSRKARPDTGTGGGASGVAESLAGLHELGLPRVAGRRGVTLSAGLVDERRQ